MHVEGCSRGLSATYGVYRKAPGLLLLPRRKKTRGEAKVTLPQAYCISLPRDTAPWTHIVCILTLFDFVLSFLYDGWQIRAACLNQVMCEAQ
jgi:hypothetical protein